MRTWRLSAAAFMALFSVAAAHGQSRGWQYSYGGGGTGYHPGVGLRPAARPNYQFGGPSPFVWYSPHEGYSYDYQNGLPWRRNTSTGPVGRSGATGVVRYSRPPHEPNDTYYVRDRVSPPNPPGDERNLQPAVAEENKARVEGPAPLSPSRPRTAGTNPTRKTSAVKKPAAVNYSAGSIRANGGGDWVPNVPTR